MSELLRVQDIGVHYGKLSALRNISFVLAAGQIVTIIGPNGAGKSTLLKALMGMLPYSGSAAFHGLPIDRVIVEERAERGLLLVPETRELFTHMSVVDNLLLGAYIHRRNRHQIDRDLNYVYELFPRLRERAAQPAGTLSGGERQMLALGRALMGRPKLLMLDEPSLGLAPLIVAEIFRVIRKLRDGGVSVLLVEQNARAALEIADYGYVLETGDLVHQGMAQDLIHDPRIMAIYLGGGQLSEHQR